MTDPAAWKAHIRQLIAARNARGQPGDEVPVHWTDDSEDVWAAREFSEVQLPVIRTELDYAVALHELGHLWGR